VFVTAFVSSGFTEIKHTPDLRNSTDSPFISLTCAVLSAVFGRREGMSSAVPSKYSLDRCTLDVVEPVTSTPATDALGLYSVASMPADYNTAISPVGGFTAALMLRAAARHLSARFGADKYPHPLTASVQFLSLVPSGVASHVRVEVLKKGAVTSRSHRSARPARAAC
jgi:hypothetical protein